MAKRTCTEDDCDRPAVSRGLCTMHYQRVRYYERRSVLTRLTCVDCGSDFDRPGKYGPIPKRCAECARLRMLERTNSGSKRGRRVHGPSSCRVCGVPTVSNAYCSQNCRSVGHMNPERPREINCSRCGIPVDLTQRGENGRLPPSYTQLCVNCRPKMRYYGMSAQQLAERDGPTCALCGEGIDFSLRSPDPMSASVDHILPRARGGTHDPANLQLAHRVCNTRKGMRI